MEPLEGRHLLSVVPVGPVREVDPSATDPQCDPAVAMAANGDYAVVWAQENGFGTRDILCQRFYADGTNKGNQIVVDSSFTNHNARDPDIAMADNSSFVVAWTNCYDPVGPDPVVTTISCRAFDQNGQTTSTEVEVPTTDVRSKEQSYPSVSMSSTGDRFVVAWTHWYDTTDPDVYARAFNWDGSAWVGDSSDRSVADSGRPEAFADVAMNSAGSYVVAWEEQGADNGDDDYDIFCRGYTSTNGTLFNQVQVNTTDVDKYQCKPLVAMPDSGPWFVVAWKHVYSPIESDVYAQKLTTAGVKSGSERTVAVTGEDEYLSGIAAGGNMWIVAFGQKDGSVRNAKGAVYDYVASGNDTWAGEFDFADSPLDASEGDIAGNENGQAVAAISHYNSGLGLTRVMHRPFAAEGSSSDKIGVHRPVGNAGYFIQDPNGNGYWDGGDRFFEFGYGTDTPIIGDWNGDGLDEIGVHRAVGNAGYFIQDYNGNGYWDGGDRYFQFGYGSDTPIIGDWNGDGYDEIGVHRPVGNAGYFIQDFNGNGYWDGGDRYFEFGYGTDTPIIGDWNGSIGDEIGVHRGVGNAGYFIQDYNGNGYWDGSDQYHVFGYASDVPIIGDWNGDGTDQIGVHREVGNAGYFIQDYSGNGYWDGGDRFFEFGYSSDIPIIGNWASASPLMAAEGEVVPDGNITTLKTVDLTPIVEEALTSFEAIGLAPRMKDVEYVITDLPGAMLGLAEHSTIYLDYNAAGHGWFVDLTPAVDEEFERIGSGESLYALDPVASDTIDLLTVVSHELGHILGLQDLAPEADSLMSSTLEKGLRRRPGDAELEAVLAGYDFGY